MFVPKLELVEFLVYVGSTISLWFGVTIIGLYDQFLQGYRQAEQKFHSPAMQTNISIIFVNLNGAVIKLKRVITLCQHKTHGE